MCQFFKKGGYPDSVVNTAQHRAQKIDRQSALQKKNRRIPFTLTYHLRNLAAKTPVILKGFKLLQNSNKQVKSFHRPH